VRDPVSFNDVVQLEMSFAEAEGEELLPLARALLALAEDPHAEDDHAPGALFGMAGQYFGDAGDHETAEELLLLSVDLDDGEGLDPRCFLVELYLDTDRVEEARSLDNEVRKRRSEELVTYSVLGRTWSARDPRRALGWFNRGLDLAERTDQDDTSTYSLLCVGRFHLRQEQGQDLDEYDEIALEVLGTDGDEDEPEG